MMTVEQFKADVWAWAEEIGVSPKEVHMRPMRRKWASCSSRGRVSFDPALLGEGEPVRHEAILHELLHLRFPNHGRMFKRLLAAYLARGLGGGNGKVVA
jgi:predicted metal-dependent hydrolase